MIDLPSNPLPHHTRAFTKAELLAVIAVLAVAMAALAPLFTPASNPAAVPSNLTRCQDNLRKIGAALLAYAQDNSGSLPLTPVVDNPHPELVRALTPRYLSDPKVFFCPSESKPELTYSQQNLEEGTIGYFYYGAAAAGSNQHLSNFLLTGVTWPRALRTSQNGSTWVMSDIWFSGLPTSHSEYRKGVNYLTLNGSVSFIAESPRQAFH